jgi:hypothetical protein
LQDRPMAGVPNKRINTDSAPCEVSSGSSRAGRAAGYPPQRSPESPLLARDRPLASAYPEGYTGKRDGDTPNNRL